MDNLSRCRQRGCNVSHEQKETLMEYETHENLRKGAFTKDFTKEEQQKQWMEITDVLNAMPGATRPWSKWRKTWQDSRSSAKKKYSSIVGSRRATGGGLDTKVKPLSTIDNKVLEMMGETIVSGHENIPESRIEMVWPDDSSKENRRTDVIAVNITDEQMEQVVQEHLREEYLDEALLGYDFYDLQDEREIERRVEAAHVRFANRNIPATETSQEVLRASNTSLNQSTANATDSTSTKKNSRPKSTAVTRLNHTLVAAGELSANVKEKTLMKKQYYEKKFELMEAQVAVQQEDAKNKMNYYYKKLQLMELKVATQQELTSTVKDLCLVVSSSN